MIILYDIDSDAATLTASTEDSNFPVENIQTTFGAEVWRTTAPTAQYVDFDLSTATSISSCGIITGEERQGVVSGRLSDSATITLEGSASGAFSGEEVTVNTFTADGERVLFETFTAVSYRYFRLNLSDATLSDIRVGRIALGAEVDTSDIRPNPKIGYKSTALNIVSVGGQSYGSKGRNYKTFDVSIPKLTIAQKDELALFAQTVQTYKPFFVDLFECTQIDPVSYVKMGQNGFTFSYNTANIFTVGLKLTEVF